MTLLPFRPVAQPVRGSDAQPLRRAKKRSCDGLPGLEPSNGVPPMEVTLPLVQWGLVKSIVRICENTNESMIQRFSPLVHDLYLL